MNPKRVRKAEQVDLIMECRSMKRFVKCFFSY